MPRDMGTVLGHHAQDRPPADSPPPSGEVVSTTVALLALSDERDLWLRRLLAAEQAAFWRGVEHGWNQGYEASCADQEAIWHEMAWRIAHGDPRSYAELQRVRGEAA